MSDPHGFEALFEKAKKNDRYWTELAVLEFTEDVVERMREEGVSRAELARRIDSSPAYITKILRGSTNFTLGSMVKVSRALGCVLRTHLQPERAGTVWFDLLDSAEEREAPLFESSRDLSETRRRFVRCDHREPAEADDDPFALAS